MRTKSFKENRKQVTIAKSSHEQVKHLEMLRVDMPHPTWPVKVHPGMACESLPSPIVWLHTYLQQGTGNKRKEYFVGTFISQQEEMEGINYTKMNNNKDTRLHMQITKSKWVLFITGIIDN